MAGGWRPTLLYPLLFAAAPVLYIAGRSAGQYRTSDLAIVLSAVVLAAALPLAAGVAIGRTFDRSGRAGPLAAACAMLLVAWCFYYLPAREAIASEARPLGSHRVLVPLGLLVTGAALVWLFRQPRERLLGLSAFMTRFGLVLVALTAFGVVTAGSRAPRAVRHSDLVRALAAPIPSADALPPSNRPARDIYLLVLDGHANARVLSEVFGFDNSRFEDSLRSLGFVVPPDVRSNYVQTYLSVSSLLNASHVTALAQDAGVTSRDHSLPTYLVRRNRTARFLKAHGYRYVLFPSAWWAATSSSPLADQEFDAEPGLDLRHELRRTELRTAVVRSTPFRPLVDGDRGMVPMVTQILRSFAGLRAIADDPASTFTFAHVLLPHVPYLVDAECRPLAHPVPDDMEADTPEQRADYIGQVHCVDRLVLELVTSLLRRSSPAPIILVVGDHGSRFADVGFYAHPERVSPAFIRERFGAFGAFYLPAGGDSVFREPVTLVNVVGNVLRYYFAADLAPSPDEMYVSGIDLYRFYRVDPGLLRP